MTTAHDATSDISTFTARYILGIAIDEPERLFTGDGDALKSEYRKLSKLWHPDLNKNPDAQNVFDHIHKLHEKAKDKMAAGTWALPGLLRLTDKDGHSYNLKYIKKHSFELGAFYISRGLVTYVIDKTVGGDLAANGLTALTGIIYADDKLRQEFTGKLPKLIKKFETDSATVCVFEKIPDMVLLSDLRDYMRAKSGKALDSKHVAWITSRLLNLECFLQTNKLTHNALSADTIFVSPENHTAALLGGWWYAAQEKTRLKGLPGALLNNVPADVLASGKAARRVDLELIRAIGRDLLGDPTGSLILRDASVPKAMAQWLTTSTSGDAFKDFQNWSEDVLKSSFGARRFTVLNVSFSDIYQPH